MRIVKVVAVWTLQILVGAMFVVLGIMKFRDPGWVRNFARWGYPDGFYMVVGVLEAAGGIGLLIPSLASYAALLMMAVMAGAAMTHLVHGEMQRLAVPLVYMVLTSAIAWLRRKSAMRRRAEPARPPAVI